MACAESQRDIHKLTILDYQKLEIKKVLGRGAFGVVFVAKYNGHGIPSLVVMKQILEPVVETTRNLFMKEAKLLSGLNHENIVQFFGICNHPLVIILEYVFFDCWPFLKRRIEINSVDKFLSEVSRLHKSDKRFDHVIPVIASDIANGLSYLHNRDIAHRDLKPMNVLISNQHYCHLEDGPELQSQMTSRPVICKLADFGESRSKLLQTDRCNDPNTNVVARGTTAFMAPEILLPEGITLLNVKLSMEDLKRVDIWALGQVFYCLMNPGVSYPFEREGLDIPEIMLMHRRQQRPSFDAGYQTKHATVWAHVKKAFESCANHDPRARPTASQVVGDLHGHQRKRRSARARRQTVSQWYYGTEGEAALKHVFAELTKVSDRDVDMSRNKTTQDISLSLSCRGRKWILAFPTAFPRRNARLRSDGKEQGNIGGDTVEVAVKNIVSFLMAQNQEDPSFHQKDSPVSSPTLQWYSGDEGEADLKYVYKGFKSIANEKVEMLRNTDTRDITFTFQREGQQWQIIFPSDFPKSPASLMKNGDEQEVIGGDNVKTATQAIVNYIISSREPSGGAFVESDGDTEVQWYVSGEGESRLKYIFDEMEKIADGVVYISRNKGTRNVTLKFDRQGQSWQIKFPPNFPRDSVRMIRDDEECGDVGGNTIESVTNGITNFITGQTYSADNEDYGMFQQAAQTTSSQWYIGENGQTALKYVVNELSHITDSQVQMSRKINTHDITLRFQRLGHRWEIEFPSNFPGSNARITVNDCSHETVGGDTLETAVTAIKNSIFRKNPVVRIVPKSAKSCITH